MNDQRDTELNVEISPNTDNSEPAEHTGNENTDDTGNRNHPGNTDIADNTEELILSGQIQRPNPEQEIASGQTERHNPEQQLASGQEQPPYPGQPNPGQPYPRQPYPGQNYPEQPYPGQTNAPWQNQPPFPGQPYPGQSYPEQPYPGQTETPWQNQQLPNVPNQGTGNFYPNQNPDFQNPHMQNQYVPNQNMQNPNFQGQQRTNQQPTNPVAVTSLILGIISMLVSCCCFPIGFIIGFVLAMIGLVLAISSKKGKPFSGYAIAGLVLSILGICESLFLFLSYLITARMMQDPNISNLMNQLMEQYERSIGPQMISFIKNLL